MKRMTIAVLALLSSCGPAFAQRAVVCPPSLSYCYEKPVLRQMTVEDEIAALRADIARDNAAVDARLRQSDKALNWELERALWLRR